MTQTLSQLENSGAFIERHIGPDAAQQQEMLNAVGAQSLNALTGQIVPKDIQLATPPQVGAPATEYAALAELKAIASRNKRFTSYIGMGYTAVQLPPVILRNMLEVEQCFKAALGDFRLIRSVRGIPARIFQHVTQDNRR
ncbi:hypothetical protein AWE72_07265 [Escherichia coli]|nr:hypothetical protein AWE72_07265 [Escherichia coli]